MVSHERECRGLAASERPRHTAAVGETFTLGDLRLVDDVSSADWIVARVRNFEHDVGSLLPVGFAAYCSGLPAPGHNGAHAPAAGGTVRWTFERGHHLLRRTVPRHGPSLVARGPKLVRCHRHRPHEDLRGRNV